MQLTQHEGDRYQWKLGATGKKQEGHLDFEPQQSVCAIPEGSRGVEPAEFARFLTALEMTNENCKLSEVLDGFWKELHRELPTQHDLRFDWGARVLYQVLKKCTA